MKKSNIFVGTILLLFIFVVSAILIGFGTSSIYQPQTADTASHNCAAGDVTMPDMTFIREETQQKLGSEEQNAIDIYKRVSPSVVNITSYKTQYINYFFEVYPETSEGQGSGAIINDKGYIVTNYHVVGDADRVTVALSQKEDV